MRRESPSAVHYGREHSRNRLTSGSPVPPTAVRIEMSLNLGREGAAREASENLEPRPICRRSAGLAHAPRGREAVGRSVGHFTDEVGLADSSFTSDQCHRTATGSRVGRSEHELANLRGASHHTLFSLPRGY